MSEEILFGTSGELSAREDAAIHVINKVRDTIISSCDKCDNGFIEVPSKSKKIEDLVVGSVKECSCRDKAAWVTKLIYSGIPRQFIASDSIDLSAMDKRSVETVKHYINKIDKAHENGLGLFFCGSQIPVPNANIARQQMAIKVLLTALEKNYTAHYIDMNSYIALQRSAARDGSYNGFLDEINAVDFLCLDNIGNVTMTEYMAGNFVSMISDRVLNKKPVIMLSHKPWDKIRVWFTEQVADMIAYNCVKVQIAEYKKKVAEFATIKGRL